MSESILIFLHMYVNNVLSEYRDAFDNGRVLAYLHDKSCRYPYKLSLVTESGKLLPLCSGPIISLLIIRFIQGIDWLSFRVAND